jgi:hypothetical protein
MANPAVNLRVRMRGGGSPPTQQFIEGVNTNAAESWYVGSPLQVNTLGAVSVAQAAVATTAFTSGAITTATLTTSAIGFAAAPSTFVKDGVGRAATSIAYTIPVVTMDQNVEIGIPVACSTNSASLPVKTLVGGTFTLVYFGMSDGSICLGVNITTTTNGCFVITEVPDGSVGVVNGLVWGKWISGERAPGVI